MKSKLTLFALLLILATCKNKERNIYYWQKENASTFTDSLTLKPYSILSYPIDHKTAVSSIPYLNILLHEGNEFVYFYNYHTNRVSIYDFSSSELVKEHNFEKQGPDGVHPSTTNQVLLSSIDSVFILDRTNKRISLFKDSILYDKIDLYRIANAKDINTYEAWQPSLMECFFKQGDSLYFSIHQYLSTAIFKCSGNCNYNTVLVVNAKQKTAKAQLPVPEVYKHGNWGVQTAVPTHLFHTFNSDDKKFVYSFAADPYIYIEGFKGYTRKFVGSKYFKAIYPVAQGNRNVDKEKSWKHSSVSPFYGRIFFDPYNNLYYRFATHGMTEDEYNKGLQSGAFSIIIIDNKFKKVGEVYFSKEQAQMYSLKHVLVSSKGLLLLRTDIYNSNPDFIPMELFVVNRL